MVFVISIGFVHLNKATASDTFGFENEPFINKRFFLSFMFFLVSLCLGAWSGKHFHDERYAIGAALIGGSWLCVLCSWGVGVWGWLL